MEARPPSGRPRSPAHPSRCSPTCAPDRPMPRVEEQLRGHRRPVGAHPARHGPRPGPGLGGQGRLQRGQQGVEGRCRTVVHTTLAPDLAQRVRAECAYRNSRRRHYVGCRTRRATWGRTAEVGPWPRAVPPGYFQESTQVEHYTICVWRKVCRGRRPSPRLPREVLRPITGSKAGEPPGPQHDARQSGAPASGHGHTSPGSPVGSPADSRTRPGRPAVPASTSPPEAQSRAFSSSNRPALSP